MKQSHYFQIFLVTILLILSSIPDIYCQTSLQGRVIDSSTIETIPFATVVIYKEGTFIDGTDTDFDGYYSFSDISPGVYDVETSFLGYEKSRITGVIVTADKLNILDFQLTEESSCIDEVVIIAYKVPLMSHNSTSAVGTITAESIKSLPSKNVNAVAATAAGLSKDGADRRRGKKKANNYEYKRDNESYHHYEENAFTQVANAPLSTFSIDVDRASYSNIRRIVNQGTLPPVDAVRIEEMINYFDYDINAEANDHPIQMSSTLTECPWNKKHQILQLSMSADQLKREDLKNSNFVFLIDVSGSMGSHNKLPLVIESLKLLVDQMQPEDQISIVTYAGRSAVALPSTAVKDKTKILMALQSLRSGGSTAGAEGIKTAYAIAQENFINNGNNRVILATDGDFNVGVSTEAGLEDLIVQHRDEGIYLTVLGYGMGNYKDDKMQLLANKGNGNHGYIDNLSEAKKLFVTEYAGTMYTVAKDVKIQIEFNPAVVGNYRLIGYENRMLATEDFKDDKKDAGEIGAGHHVTAFYEIIPVGTKSKYNKDSVKLKYSARHSVNEQSEICTIKVRYKKPKKTKSIKFEMPIDNELTPIEDASSETKFALGVAECGLLLRESKLADDVSYDSVLALIQDGLNHDPYEERAEFQSLVNTIKSIAGSSASLNYE